METNPQAQGQPPRKGVGPDLTTDERALIAALLGSAAAEQTPPMPTMGMETAS